MTKPMQLPSPPAEDPQFLTQQLVTYLGNKRALLGFIGEGVERVRQRLRQPTLTTLDLFAGSGVVSRYLRRFSHAHISNDLEVFAEVIARCYLAHPSPALLAELAWHHAALTRDLRAGNLQPGWLCAHYAPEDDAHIGPGERVFYTRHNALFLDTARRRIAEIPQELQAFFLAPLLSLASVHANTSGVFKGFYKDRATGRGRFGGTAENALQRILRPMVLPMPIFSRFQPPTAIHRGDANVLAPGLPPVDLAYLDPPYNQHPYGSNYFLLNHLATGEAPRAVSAVSGIPRDWQRSAYNVRGRSAAALATLVAAIRARFLLISFNSQGFIAHDEMLQLLGRVGRVDVLETRYNTFRGSRNLRQRELHVREYLFLVEKS